ncbi:pyroglutamyl-peptidase [Pseudomonas duriflava]|uniref:Pyrrolidone-carboxylate peptidase n=1 Tax=Pseudomonas duriflava TaxID=459528 RepID=A0A562QDP2_9PSED|nr:pyroglutamyl-peptidase I [Pseudomonas duriflava]TWI54813.1 pyroglutamyl-peptidase [Pseudomonas duriflava]
MTTILLTGFEPFENEPINPSWEAVRRLDGLKLSSAYIVTRQLPCVFGAALVALDHALAAYQPALVIGVGQAGGRADLSIERVAINVNDARIADNNGQQPIDTPVVPGGPAAYFSTLPIKAMAHALRTSGIPASISQTAGTFVCNHVFYGLMHRLAGTNVRAGFIHIPYLPEQAARHPGQPSLALDTVVAGLELALRTAIATGKDLRETGGQLN